MDGLCKLVTLSLERTPCMDLIASTAGTWIEALCHGREWRQSLDQLRVRRAFIALAGTCTVWPAPRQLLDAMPRRITVMKILAGVRPDTSSFGGARPRARWLSRWLPRIRGWPALVEPLARDPARGTEPHPICP